MEMAQIRYFLALCEERNFTRAARRCGEKQPSLTRAIKFLEQELGGSLFEQNVTCARMTEFGKELEPYFATIARCAAEIKRTPTPNVNDHKLAKDIARKLAL